MLHFTPHVTCRRPATHFRGQSLTPEDRTITITPVPPHTEIGRVMQVHFPRLNRWRLLAVIALAAVFVGGATARGQPPRPRPQPGEQPRIFRPPGQGNRQPVGPQWPNNQRLVELTTIYSCSRCNAELGRGPVPPQLAVCPHCGCRFAANPVRVTVRAEAIGPGGWFPRLSPAFFVTLGMEGSLLAGMVLAGVVRLAVARATRPVPAEQQL
jgi:DNA-directed RNA polymerase subunit RPC12/RpoP